MVFTVTTNKPRLLTFLIISNGLFAVTQCSHYIECPEQTYCLNGGTCLYIPDLTVHFCHCPAEWRGKRCEEIDIVAMFPGFAEYSVL